MTALTLTYNAVNAIEHFKNLGPEHHPQHHFEHPSLNDKSFNRSYSYINDDIKLNADEDNLLSLLGRISKYTKSPYAPPQEDESYRYENLFHRDLYSIYETLKKVKDLSKHYKDEQEEFFEQAHNYLVLLHELYDMKLNALKGQSDSDQDTQYCKNCYHLTDKQPKIITTSTLLQHISHIDTDGKLIIEFNKFDEVAYRITHHLDEPGTNETDHKKHLEQVIFCTNFKDFEDRRELSQDISQFFKNVKITNHNTHIHKDLCRQNLYGIEHKFDSYVRSTQARFSSTIEHLDDAKVTKYLDEMQRSIEAYNEALDKTEVTSMIKAEVKKFRNIIKTKH